MRNPSLALVLAPLAALVAGCPEPGTGSDAFTAFTYRVVAEYPHDPEAFTQGLVYEGDGMLLEGTGLFGESTLRRVELETGAVRQRIELNDDYFGEGVTLFEGEIIQLTWRSNLGLVYGQQSLEVLDTFTYPTEGWGLTHDGERMIMSDGTATLHFLDPITFEEVNSVDVRDAMGPVRRLNELEYIEGAVFANVWRTDFIVRIDPETGEVTGRADLTGLLPPEDRDGTEDVLNGIAYDSAGDRLFVTGKLWPKLYEIELVPIEDGGA